jgi:hypothetical protein
MEAAKALIKGAKSPSKVSRGGDEPSPIYTIVDTIVGVLENSSSFLKIMSLHAFGMLSPCVDTATVELILMV